MEGNQDSSTVKALVDVLSASLQNLSEKINSINPILSNVNNNLDKQIADINKILFDTQSISKSLDTTVSDFYKRTDNIIENINFIKTKLETIDTIKENIEKIKNSIITINTTVSSCANSNNSVLKELSDLKEGINPVSTLSKWLTKPIGILAFLISLILASMAVVNGFSSVLEYFSTTKHNVMQIRNQHYDNQSEKHFTKDSTR